MSLHQDIFESKADALVNPVNCVGVMGGGLAKEFRLRYPRMNEAYQEACARGEVKVGKMWQWWQPPIISQGRWIINFPTKDDWREPSKLAYIGNGLRDLTRVVSDLELKSIAVPALGCGLGGLDWATVAPMIINAVSGLCELELYPPQKGRP